MAHQPIEDGADLLGADLADQITELVAFADHPARRAELISALIACAVEAARWRGDFGCAEAESVADVVGAARRHQQAMARRPVKSMPGGLVLTHHGSDLEARENSPWP